MNVTANFLVRKLCVLPWVMGGRQRWLGVRWFQKIKIKAQCRVTKPAPVWNGSLLADGWEQVNLWYEAEGCSYHSCMEPTHSTGIPSTHAWSLPTPQEFPALMHGAYPLQRRVVIHNQGAPRSPKSASEHGSPLPATDLGWIVTDERGQHAISRKLTLRKFVLMCRCV